MKRCIWCNLKNPKYIQYHDEEWGKPCFDDAYLFEMLVLESFQAGLSWECILNKREGFKEAFADFNVDKVAQYDKDKIEELCHNQKIVRNRLKIQAAIKNAEIFVTIQKEYGSFIEYLKQFWNGKIIVDAQSTTSVLSDKISADLKRRGMRYVGSTIIHSYLQAIGIINAHDAGCAWSIKNGKGMAEKL